MNELSFNLLGAGWVDRSTQSLEVRMPDGGLLLMQIEREHAMSLEILRDRVSDEIQERRRALRGFELIARNDFRGDSVQGIALSYRTVSPDGARYHEVAYVPLVNVLLIFSVTAWSPYEADCREVIREAVGSIQVG